MNTVLRVGPGSQGILQHKGDLGLSVQDEKIFTLVVGQIIPAIATGALIACIVFSFIVTPLFAIGAVVAFVIGFLGVGATYTNESELASQEVRSVDLPPPFEPNQPVGIQNGGNNCWANAALQLILNNPGLEEECRTDPAFADIFSRYRDAQAAHQYTCGYLGREVRATLHQRAPHIDAGSNMEDVSDFFSTILGRIDQRRSQRAPAFYMLQQSINEGHYRPFPEPLIALQMQDTLDFEGMFDSFFNFTAPYGLENQPASVRKVFPTAPPTLVIQIKRFGHIHNDNGSVDPVKDSRLLDIPLEMAMAANISQDEVAARYECTGFIEHTGKFVNNGHYISYVKREGKWWICDDANVREATAEEVVRAKMKSYMISYRKI